MDDEGHVFIRNLLRPVNAILNLNQTQVILFGDNPLLLVKCALLCIGKANAVRAWMRTGWAIEGPT